MFSYKHGDCYMLIGLYVDDGIAASNRPAELDRLFAYLNEKYTMKVCEPTKFIGLEIRRANGNLYLHQRSYIEKILALFGMTTCRPIATPAPKGYPVRHDDLYDPSIHAIFRSIVASLLYLARMSRPDIAFIVGVLATKVDCPSAADLGLAKRVLRYLSATVSLEMVFTKPNDPKLVAYCDANFGVEPRGLSRTGAIMELFGNPVGWWSKLQSVPARSSTEAEWYSIDFALRECLPVKQLLEDLQFRIHCCHILNDNLSAIQLCRDEPGKKNPRTKHVERAFYFIRHYTQTGEFQLDYMSTDRQPADLLTKSLAKEAHQRHVRALKLVSHPQTD